MDNIPNYVKIKVALKRQNTKRKYLMDYEKDNNKGNPMKKRRYQDINIYNIKILNNIHPEFKGNMSSMTDELKSKSINSDTRKIYKIIKSEKNNIIIMA